jgi:hypothetical protein
VHWIVIASNRLFDCPVPACPLIYFLQSWTTADENTRTQTHPSITPGLHTTLPNVLEGEMPADALLDEINCQSHLREGNPHPIYKEQPQE